MFNQNNAGYTGASCTGISLYNLVSRLVGNSQAAGSRNHHVIVNEVPQDLRIAADEERLSSVIYSLLSSVLDNAKNGEIFIGASRCRDIVIFEIQDRNNYNGYALGCRLKSVEPEARKMGGDINISGLRQLIATISFSFPNLTA